MSELDLPKDRKIIWRWIPPLRSDNHINDVADEYVIAENKEAVGGIIVYGKYHDTWRLSTDRHVIAELLRQNATISKTMNDKLLRISSLAHQAGLNHHSVIKYMNEIDNIIKQIRRVG